MAVEEKLLAGGTTWRGLNRRGSASNLDPSEAVEALDCGNWERNVGTCGPRPGRSRITTHTYSLLGLGLLAAGIGRYKILADASGAWTGSVVPWNGVTPSSAGQPTITGMSTTETARFTQFKQRAYGTNGKQRPQSFNGNTWENVGILGGVDLPQFQPTVSYGGGAQTVNTAALTSNVATLTTTNPHGFTTGQSVTVLLSTGDTTFNGTYVITGTPTSTTFTYARTHANIASVGVAGTATVATGRGTSKLVTSGGGTLATITTIGNHGFATGQSATFTAPAGGRGALYPYFVTNSPFTITVTGLTTFTVVTAGRSDGTDYDLTHGESGMDVYVGAAPVTGITGTYYYAIAPANSKRLDANGRNIEGNPSLVSAAAEPTGGSVIVASIPSTHTDSQVDYWNIYRTVNGGFDSTIVPEQQDFFYLGRVAVGTTTYTDVTDDDSGWYISGTTINVLRWGQNIPPTTKYMIPFGERVFAWGFDPIGGTATVSHGSASVTTSSVSLPNGVKGCFIRFGGEDATYVIKTRSSTTALTLDRVYEGAQTTLAPFTIFRNNYELYGSEYRDADGWGPDGEFFRNKWEMPGQQELIGGATLKDRLFLFTRNDIYAVYGKGPNRFDVKITTDPVYSGIGALSGDAIFRVDNEIHFLSEEGPAILSESGVELSGVNLNTDWLDDLAETEKKRACVGSDGRHVWFCVPVSGQTLNSKTYRFDRDTKAWWEETGMHPLRFVRQDGADGQTNILYFLQDRFVIQPAYGTVDLVTALSGSRTGSTSTSLTDSTATFPTTNGGLEQCYIRIYSSTGSLLATRRVISNTSTSVTWSSDTTLPGTGTYTAAAGTTYEIGSVSWYWTTKTLETPGHLVRTDDLRITFEPIT